MILTLYIKFIFFNVVHSRDGILLTGGTSFERNDEGVPVARKQVELVVPGYPEKSCVLDKPLPLEYYRHTQDTILNNNRALICGGRLLKTQTICLEWNSTTGEFPDEPAHTFGKHWFDHVSWTTFIDFTFLSQTFIIGGTLDEVINISVVVQQNIVKAEPAFNLTTPSSGSCAITNLEEVIVTGGRAPSLRNVTSYDQFGNATERPPLKQGRFNHGCTRYFSKGREYLLVTGGQITDDPLTFLDSTEIFHRGKWRYVNSGDLPYRTSYPRVISLDSEIFALGGSNGDNKTSEEFFLDTILKWNKKQKKWKYQKYQKQNKWKYQRLYVGKNQFAVSIVNIKDYKDYCV